MEQTKGQIRLRKVSENEIHGPMDMDELAALAAGAFVAPEDEVSFDGKEWTPAPEMKELEMFWIIHTDDGAQYGPTSEGTIREFLSAEELTQSHIIEDARDGNKLTVAELLGAEVVDEVMAEQADSEGIPMADIEETLDTAKDLRIRQLEADFDHLQREHDKLMAQYRKVSEELIRLKKAT
jgi:hypothetical protein